MQDRSPFPITLVSGNLIFNRLNINGLCLALFFVPLLLEGHYDLWLDSLVATVSVCDPLFEPATEQAWRAMLRPGIEIMQAMQGQPRP